jgi:hypothetical protein
MEKVGALLPEMQKTDTYPRPEKPLDQYFFSTDPRHGDENE